MHWIIASLISAFFLGFYDLCIKHAVRENAVLPVLFFANVCSAGVWLLLIAVQKLDPPFVPAALSVPSLGLRQHLELLLKSAIVAASWVCSYFAVKHLPISLASPIRATSPIWTLAGALLVLDERPHWLQMVGIVVTLGAFIGISLAGKREGIHFHRDKWIAWLFVGTLLAGVSGLYDKILLGRLGFAASTVQAWFFIYLALLFLPLAAGWKLRWWPRHAFGWRWSIVGVSAALLVSDFVYFSALHDPHALVSIVSSLRRGSTLVAFAGGILVFHEANARQKLPAVLGVLAGMALIVGG